jgi:hypothetical protein
MSGPKILKIFMSNFKFEVEWIEPEAAKGSELAATWASLRVLVKDAPITRLSASAGIRERIFLPLYPLAEWLALNWWFIKGEVQAENQKGAEGYATRHNIRYAREGFALPNLMLQPLGEKRMELRWWPERLHFQKVEFLEEGIAELDKYDVLDELQKFIDDVIDRLEDTGLTGTVLQQEWTEIKATALEEEDFCILTASLGIDPYTLEEKSQQLIIETYDSLPKNITPDFFAVANFQQLKKQGNELLNSIHRLGRVKIANHKLLQIKNKVTRQLQKVERPWEQGYKAALLMRKELGLNGQAIGELDELGGYLGYKPGDFNKAIISETNSNLPVAALVSTNSEGAPAFYLNERKIPALTKFTFCRSLFDYISTDAVQTSLVTGAKNEHQKRNRAFAAEFLAPHHSIQKEIPGDFVTSDEIDELAHKFNVSAFVIKHQIENHHLADMYED